jgi:two-component system chemotaxis sensor kinase CheA
MNSPTETFIQETLDGLETLEQALLQLEDTETPDLVDHVFRTLHTIKGSGSMFGFAALARFTHQFENAFERVRDGKLSLSHELVSTALDARDHMLALLENNADASALEALESSEAAQKLCARIAAFVDLPDRTESVAPAAVSDGDLAHYAIRYAPNADSLKNGQRPDLLLDELAGLGEARWTLDLSSVPALGTFDPQASYAIWNIALETTASEADVLSVFVFNDEAEYQVEKMKAPTPEDEGGLDNEPLEHGANDRKPSSAPVAEADSPRAATAPTKPTSVRVAAERLDELMDQLGELVIAGARLEQLASASSDPALAAVSEEVDRLVTGLRDSALSMRMLPIETAFGKFRRVVRALSDDLGKKVSLVTTGGDTELDKNVIDSLTEPLVHMIRNSMDHGIEDAATRKAAGKPEKATIGLSARQRGGEVLITVSDDGKGLNDEKIIAKARERGLIGRRADDVPPPHILHQLIFEPAFSTADQISSVSGRGVGMDAVRRVVQDLRGSIEIKTREHVGTAITLRLPVTLAIIDGLLVRVGDRVFVLPLSAVNECVEMSSAECTRKSGRTMLRIRDDLVPFVQLHERFGMPAGEAKTRRVVIVTSDRRRVGLVVDDILGQHQTVIKTFSPFHSDVAGFAGSTILGDGRVALIVDVGELVKSAQDARALPDEVAA